MSASVRIGGGVFYLLGLYAFCRSCETDARRRTWLALVILCYACGLHCKETAISFPLVLSGTTEHWSPAAGALSGIARLFTVCFVWRPSSWRARRWLPRLEL